jgi:hypothetical protein
VVGAADTPDAGTNSPVDGAAFGTDALALPDSSASDLAGEGDQVDSGIDVAVDGNIDAAVEVPDSVVGRDNRGTEVDVNATPPRDSDSDAAPPNDVTPDAGMDSTDSLGAVDGEDGAGDVDASEDATVPPGMCPEWAGSMDNPIAYDPCDPIVVTPETKDVVVPVPTACAVPVPYTGELDAVYDLTDALYVFGWDAIGALDGYAGGIETLVVDSDDGAWIVVQKPAKSGYLEDFTTYGPTRVWTDHVGGSGNVIFSGPLLVEAGTNYVMWADALSNGDLLLYGMMEPLFPASDFPGYFNFGLFQAHAGDIAWSTSMWMTEMASGSLWKGRVAGNQIAAVGAPSEAVFADHPCADTVMTQTDLEGNLEWFSPLGTKGDVPDSKGGAGASDAPVRLGDCGYALAQVVTGESEVPGYTFIKLSRVSYFTLDGKLVRQKLYAAGWWGYGYIFADADGLEVVTARTINGTYQNPISIGSQIGVLRLQADGSLKWFTLLTEPEKLWSSLYANAVLALPNGLTIVSCSINSGKTKVFVLGPDGCVLAVYLFKDDDVSNAGDYNDFLHLTRLADGTFAAHDQRRVYFFHLPAVDEWEASAAAP